jgi:hypothetical protein
VEECGQHEVPAPSGERGLDAGLSHGRCNSVPASSTKRLIAHTVREVSYRNPLSVSEPGQHVAGSGPGIAADLRSRSAGANPGGLGGPSQACSYTESNMLTGLHRNPEEALVEGIRRDIQCVEPCGETEPKTRYRRFEAGHGVSIEHLRPHGGGAGRGCRDRSGAA